MKGVFSLLLALWITPALFSAAGHPALEPLKNLKELPLALVDDFSLDESVAAPALPVVNPKGFLFFYDYKLRRIARTSISGDGLRQIGGFGEGPEEYTHVSGLWTGGDRLYAVDLKGKICCFDLDGAFQWEKHLDRTSPQLLGMAGDRMFFSIFSRYSSKTRAIRLFSWKPEERPRELLTLPVEFTTVTAYADGKVLKGGGIVMVSVPAVAVWKHTLVTSAYGDYRFDLRDLDGGQKQQVVVTAPAPEHSPRWISFPAAREKTVYAVREIFPSDNYLILISNYYRDGKPRIDFFDWRGQPLKSFVLPFAADGQTTRIHIQAPYLFYMDRGESGFKVYKITAKI